MEKVLGIVRHVISTLGGALLGAGLVSESDNLTLIGVVLPCIAGIWSYISKVKSEVKL